MISCCCTFLVAMDVSVRVGVVPVFAARRTQRSPWRHVPTGTEGREPSGHWTASPDTPEDPAETLGVSGPRGGKEAGDGRLRYLLLANEAEVGRGHS